MQLKSCKNTEAWYRNAVSERRHQAALHFTSKETFTGRPQHVLLHKARESKRGQTLSFKQMLYLWEAEPHLSSPRCDAFTGLTLSLRSGECVTPVRWHAIQLVLFVTGSKALTLCLFHSSQRLVLFGHSKKKTTLHSQVMNIYVAALRFFLSVWKDRNSLHINLSVK